MTNRLILLASIFALTGSVWATNQDTKEPQGKTTLQYEPLTLESAAVYDDESKRAIPFLPMGRYEFGTKDQVFEALKLTLPYTQLFCDKSKILDTLAHCSLYGFAIELTFREALAEYAKYLTTNPPQSNLTLDLIKEYEKQVPLFCFTFVQSAEAYTPPPADTN